MLSEFCVRRPVSATMLVLSLVVLGLFSFRDLGVDLFPKADPATRAFPFEAVVGNADATLKPGPFVRVHIESGKIDDVLTLPYSSLQYRYGVNRVFVVAGDKVDKLTMRELQVGERMGDRIEIVNGVKEGERVAITDVDTLADGTVVAVKK